jgi:hypothetical protein
VLVHGENQSSRPARRAAVGLSVQAVDENNYTRKCLDADNGAGGKPPNGTVLQQWDCISHLNDWNVGNQLWRDYK